MKKALAVFLAALLLLSAAACGDQDTPGSHSNTSYEAASSEPSDTSSAASSSEPDEEAPPSSSHNITSKNHSASSSKTSSKTSSAASSTPPKTTVSILIPPGFSVGQIADRLEAKGVCDKDAFLKAVNEGDFSSFSLVKNIPANANRCFRLEGYLFPDTYEFYTNSDPETVIKKILQNTEKKIGSKYQYTGMSTHELIILASIIEKECGTSDRNKVSTVLHNRLKLGRKLQCDATINYVEREIKPYITGDKNRYNSYYNTYKCSALPAGPICNPSAKSLAAAANPAAGDYLYFGSRDDGSYYFMTEEEWVAANTPSSAAGAPAE